MKNSENSIAVSRALEMYRGSEYSVTATDFLTPGEKKEVYNELIARVGNGVSRCFFWGGCRGTERCTAVFLPEWAMTEEMPPHAMMADEERTGAFASFLLRSPEISDEIPICAMRIRGSGFRDLTHRDFMGGLLSLGIDRSVVGDIAVVSESEALVMVLKKIAPFIETELTKIGRDGVRAERVPISPDFLLPRRYEEMILMTASLRLDGIVKAVTGKSREAAAEMVREGLTELSYSCVTEVAAEVKPGDILSVRGFGKYEIGEISGSTKSGKLKVRCRKYL